MYCMAKLVRTHEVSHGLSLTRRKRLTIGDQIDVDVVKQPPEFDTQDMGQKFGILQAPPSTGSCLHKPDAKTHTPVMPI